jgi:ribokinase
MTDRPARLFVVGSANMDLVVRAPFLPAPGQTVLGSDLMRAPGGKGANQAVAAARLGASVVFVGNVGADANGDDLRAALAGDGVDAENLFCSADRPSGVALIVVDERGENLIAVSPGANTALRADQVDAALASARGGDVLLVQLEVPLETTWHACSVARQQGARVILNAAPANPLVVDRLDLVSVLIVNAGEAAALSGSTHAETAAVALLQRGPEVVVVTRGADGLVLAHQPGVLAIGAQPVEVVDATAAGDAFCGAFATALLEGRDWEWAARFATVAAGLATTRPGAQPSLPRRAALDDWFRGS